MHTGTGTGLLYLGVLGGIVYTPAYSTDFTFHMFQVEWRRELRQL